MIIFNSAIKSSTKVRLHFNLRTLINMNLFKKFFVGDTLGKEKKELPWITLDSVEQLDVIKEKSKVKTQVIYKHSRECVGSELVMERFVDNYQLTANDLDLHYLDLNDYEEVSNRTGQKFNIDNESPQLIVLRNEDVVIYTSNDAINMLNLEQLV